MATVINVGKQGFTIKLPRQLIEEIEAIASNERRKPTAVARLLLEAGLDAFYRGRIPLLGQPPKRKARVLPFDRAPR